MSLIRPDTNMVKDCFHIRESIIKWVNACKRVQGRVLEAQQTYSLEDIEAIFGVDYDELVTVINLINSIVTEHG